MAELPDRSALRGRTLGACAECGRQVFIEQHFTRMAGRVVHLRCPITARGISLTASAPRSESAGRGR
jgi:hypothetical protein